MTDVLDLDFPPALRDALAFDASYLATIVEPIRQRVLAAWPAAERAFAAEHGRPPTYDEVRAILEAMPDYRAEWTLSAHGVDRRWRDLLAATEHNDRATFRK